MSATTPTIDPRTPSADAVEAAQLISGPFTRLDRWVDRLNPIFVKETRQALKSKQFLIAFLLMLLVSWLISLVAVASAGQELDFGNWGRDLFTCYFVVLAGAILVVVPFTAFRSLVVERDDATYEPLVISTLSPRQIIFGKLQSALLQTFLYYSAIAPFMAFTALLQGFDFAHVLLLLGMGLGASLWASVAALAISAMLKMRGAQTIISLVVLAGLLGAFITAWASAFETQWIIWSDPKVFVVLAIWIVVGVSNIVLLQQIAVANLTFASDNRSSGLRLIIQAQFLLIWACIFGTEWWMGVSRYRAEFVLMGVASSLVLWSAAGLFFVNESNHLSRRLIRQLPDNGFLRLLYAPFYPGGSRGLMLVLANLLIIGAILAADAQYAGWMVAGAEVSLPLAGGLYVVIFLNLSAWIARWGMAQSSAIQPIHARVGTLVLIAICMTLPMFTMLFDNYSTYQDYSLLYVVSPAMTLDYLSSRLAQTQNVLSLLAIGALLTTAVNLPAMARGLFEMVEGELPPVHDDEPTPYLSNRPV
jgi:hypothetical protein